MITITLTILFYSLSAIGILFVLGIGLTLLSIPNKLKSYTLWLSPWYAMFFLIFFLVIFSLFGFSVKQSSPFLIIFLLALDIIAIYVKKLKFEFNPKIDVIILVFVIMSILFNSSPIIRRFKVLTTLSLGNNDVVVYAAVSDNLTQHSIASNYAFINDPLKPTSFGVSGMIKDNFRWGSPIMASFFLNIFQLKGYQYIYLFELLLFGLTIPLIYTLFKILFKNSIYGLFLSLIIFSFNANLLYIIYHNFFGQIFFWGIEIFLLIHLVLYLSSNEFKNKSFNKFDYIIGLTISVLFFSYHEAAILIIAPIVLLFLINVIRRNYPLKQLRAIIRFIFIAGVTSFFSIIHAIRIDLLQAGGLDAPIGWQLFRQKIPFANPFEAMGFYSIHSFEPLPTFLAILFSLLVIFIIIKGIIQVKQKLIIISFVAIYLFFYYWTGIAHDNFFAYNRALTYTLPLIIILFSIGATSIYENKKYIGIFIIIFLSCAVIYSGFKLNKRFRGEYQGIDDSLISLVELNKNEEITEPIYLEHTMTGPTNLWREFWTDYFLYPNYSIYTPFNIFRTKDQIEDGSLMLISKSSILYNNPSKILIDSTEWENKYYLLGRLCNSDKCLLDSKVDLSKITVGKNNYEDSLFLLGWGMNEGDSRWANAEESTLRIVTKDTYPTQLTIEALSLSEPQEIAVYIDNELLGRISVGTEWQSYTLPIDYFLKSGVHQIKLTYSHGYRPMDVIPSNLDGRTLYINLKQISIQ